MISFKQPPRIQGLDKAVRQLQEVDKGIVNKLRRDMKKESTPVLNEILTEVNIGAPLSGMKGTHRTAWSGVKGGFSFRPNARERAKGYTPIINMTLRSKGSTAGFEIAEMAGSKNLAFSKNPKRGKQFVSALQKSSGKPFKAGRFGYASFLTKRPDVQQAVIRVIDDFAKQFNKRIRQR